MQREFSGHAIGAWRFHDEHSADWSCFVRCTAAVTARFISQALAAGCPCEQPSFAHDRQSRLVNAKSHSERTDA